MTQQFIAEVTHFYNKIGVAVLALQGEIHLGDTIHIQGHTTDFQQAIGSLQIDHQRVEKAGPGDDVAVRVFNRVRPGDRVYRVPERN